MFEDNQDQGFQFNGILHDGRGRPGHADLVWRTHHQPWRSRFDGIALAPKPATGLGKIEWESVYYGDSPKKSGGYAKTGDLRPLGKIPAKPVYLGDHAFPDGDPAKAGDNPEPAGKKSGETANHGDSAMAEDFFAELSLSVKLEQ